MPPDRYLVMGASGHARVVADLVQAVGARLVGHVGRVASDLGRVVDGSEVVTTDDDVLEFCERGGADWIAIGVGERRPRLDAVARFASHLAPALVHPSAVVSGSARVGDGTVVMPLVAVNTGAAIGRGVILNTSCVVEHDCVVADGAHVSPGAVLAGGVRIERGAWVGAGATVLPARTVGSDAVVGAGAVVVRDVPDGTVVMGNPARSR